jgi:glutamate-1-semialdehyde 2,1-aminomutase
LREIQRPGFYDELGQRAGRLIEDSPKQRTRRLPGGTLPVIASVGCSDLLLRAASSQPCSGHGCRQERFNRFFHAMLERGVYLAPSAFEAGFVSIAHDAAVIDATWSPPAMRLRTRKNRPGVGNSRPVSHLAGNQCGV